MKNITALVLLALCIAAPSFAGDAIGHTAKVAGKDSAKAAAVAAKDTGKATVKVVKLLF